MTRDHRFKRVTDLDRIKEPLADACGLQVIHLQIQTRSQSKTFAIIFLIQSVNYIRSDQSDLCKMMLSPSKKKSQEYQEI